MLDNVEVENDGLEPVTWLNFCERAYRAANADIDEAIKSGSLESGHAHFEVFGHLESHRKQVAAIARTERRMRRARIESILDKSLPYVDDGHLFDFLSPELKEQFNIQDSPLIGENLYDADALSVIQRHRDGLVLDCGAGSRPTIYENVINFEISAYPSTDVRGAGERLPFLDHSFDAVLSLNVLEHVKDPFLAAKELLRVLKPGGDLVVVVPLTQPTHGYPHHYYNMTAEGILNLFNPSIDVERVYVPISTSPIWTLVWITRDWADGLDEQALEDFKSVTIGDLLNGAPPLLDRPFVRNLSDTKNLELASSTTLLAKKK
ncbi:methyltransferase domain-containing protein [Paraburkholderia sediminicola]|uniref:methyltransferase domain-containing protein n=1 Tax=Paraburkholderia sediminicola TaxID=458836 RepID=UPI0038B72B1D